MPQLNTSEDAAKHTKSVSPISKKLLKRRPVARWKWRKRFGLAFLCLGAMGTAVMVSMVLYPQQLELVIHDFIATSYHPDESSEISPSASESSIWNDLETKPKQVDPEPIASAHKNTSALSTAGEVNLDSKPVSTEVSFNELIAECQEDKVVQKKAVVLREPTIDALMEEYLSGELHELRTDYDRKLVALRSDAGKNKRLGREFYAAAAKLSDLAHRAGGIPLSIHNVLKELTTDRNVYMLVSSASNSWLRWSERESNGIVVAGRVVAVSADDKSQVRIRIRDRAKTVLNVQITNPMSAIPGDELIVLGRVIEQSSGNRIRGYAQNFKELKAQVRRGE